MTSTTAPRSVRDRLIDAAEECLRTKGIRATTVSEVAEAAGVSRGWLYRHFPDKVTLLGAVIVRLNDTFWSEAHAMLEEIDGLDRQLVAGIANGLRAYDDPGAVLMKLRTDEPEEFAACAGAGVQGMIPDLAEFWSRYLIAARDRGEVHADVDVPEASEWIARVLISLATVPGNTLDPSDGDAVLAHVRRYVMPGLKADPAV
ncbi:MULTISPECIES: TetR/AcrR family transcriptional regulator [unclassified Mycolicibacterium]|uniref:TetR/AcrR family transcriptional regulator n=1 Tax=unclassified Mycolicibacterium TaxID=2636767 RepID=UPI0012DF47F4|nr:MULTISPECIES: TetR/AcrR family transcriptional regulator [unclassified Mycolicibacterium]MUL84840.1 TetR/AcrR family transcriptional regulator [Mycolicibacterium sp. CBMA 329]MUL90807.1 TetR/AcrR family transcriptional regulator [Mycolicibacterium sp. CBMA 331]MUM01755.1 TetR/AcrR family transcriptional regulator [Mycolicibacterium sp. CBMA 334]MUM40566.1 TetR/AcrR family transcriptional regulator [Mycolicibacterium sp. CBMA 247]MUM46762.1 TetR/AcrR family transcriptional regulator [Mycolic